MTMATQSAAFYEFRLLAEDEKDEGAGLHFAAAFARCGRIEIGGREKNVVGLEVEAHGAGASLGGNIFDNCIFVRGILMDNREVAVAAGCKNITGRGIESASIRAFADGWGGDDFSGVDVH